MKRSFLRPADIVLTAALLIICGALLIVPKKGGAAVEVKVDGEVKAVLPLNTDGEYAFGAVKVTVKDGEAWISDSDCADKTCVRTGHLSSAGDTAVCLPNKTVCTVTGGNKADGVTW